MLTFLAISPLLLVHFSAFLVLRCSEEIALSTGQNIFLPFYKKKGLPVVPKNSKLSTGRLTDGQTTRQTNRRRWKYYPLPERQPIINAKCPANLLWQGNGIYNWNLRDSKWPTSPWWKVEFSNPAQCHILWKGNYEDFLMVTLLLP